MSDLLLDRPAAASTASVRSAAEVAAATVWRWRDRAAASDADAAASAARKKGLLGGAIGLLAAFAVSFWRPGAAWVVAGIALTMTLLALVSPLGLFRRVTRALDAFAHGVGVTLTWV